MAGDRAEGSPRRRAPPPPRGEFIDIGGRRLRVVREGPADRRPVIVFEAGAFGASPDWAAVQAALGPSVRTFAYDRAGLGLSDPGPLPRTSRSIASDLKALLAASREEGPYLLVGHSMAAVHLWVFALQNSEDVEGLVLIDAAPPNALATRRGRTFIGALGRLAGAAPLAARLGLGSALSPIAGDAIDLPEPAKGEKRRFFASPVHNFWGAEEVKAWMEDAEQAHGLGELDRELPVAVVSAGGRAGAWRRLQAEPARRSRSGYAVSLPGAGHASILGPRFAPAVVKAIEFVGDAARARRP